MLLRFRSRAMMSLIAAATPTICQRGYASSQMSNGAAQRSYEAGVEKATVDNGAASELQQDVKTANVDTSHITKAHVWGLWNEGNLFSLSVPELTAFLVKECDTEVDPKAKKSALVRMVEEKMSSEQPSLARTDDDATALLQDEYSSQGGDLYEEADVYGDWGADPGFEDRRGLDFMEVKQSAIQSEIASPLAPRAYQLLHSDATADVALCRFDPRKLPGLAEWKEAYTPRQVSANDANKIRFRKSFRWCVTNLWNMNMDGELNVGAGKALYWRAVAKYNRNVLPIWTCQEHLCNTHPYTWFAVAHESNTAQMVKFAETLGMKQTMEPQTSYKVMLKRSRDFLDIELNSQLQCTMVNKPWDRFLCVHYVRSKLPDLRYLVRARTPMKKKIADAYFETDILKLTKDSVQSVLAPELGEVVYTSERVIRKWSAKIASGVNLQLVETKRIPLIVTRPGEEGERLEYELISSIPQKAERVDLNALSDDLWSHGNEFALVLEEGMQELHAHTMPSSAAFEQPAV